jgi:hypothetical protein
VVGRHNVYRVFFHRASDYHNDYNNHDNDYDHDNYDYNNHYSCARGLQCSSVRHTTDLRR